MLAAIDANTRVVFIANPNNPTGTWFDTEALDEFLQDVPEHVLVVLDEAYIEYAEGSDLPDGLILSRLTRTCWFLVRSPRPMAWRRYRLAIACPLPWSPTC